MKKEYTSPEILISFFETETIMADSGVTPGLIPGGALGSDEAIEIE